MANLSWLTLAAAVFLLPYSGDGGVQAAVEPTAWRQPVIADLRHGDIVFRRGVGPVADAVAAASFSSVGRAQWTHVGIVAQPALGGPLYVLHAIDDRGVVLDPPERFFSAAESAAGSFVRIDGGEGVARMAMNYVGRPFDGSLSLSDRQEALYCTELVYVSMFHAGIRPKVALRKLPLTEPVMFPDDLHRALRNL